MPFGDRVYSDEASMVHGNGSTGDSTFLVVEEAETGLIPRAQTQPVASLFVVKGSL